MATIFASFHESRLLCSEFQYTIRPLKPARWQSLALGTASLLAQYSRLGINMAAQEALPFSGFAYRKNADGTYDSICMECFQTVANGKTVDELAGQEFLHTLQCFGKKPPARDCSPR